jgi:hypothetical protein
MVRGRSGTLYTHMQLTVRPIDETALYARMGTPVLEIKV